MHNLYNTLIKFLVVLIACMVITFFLLAFIASTWILIMYPILQVELASYTSAAIILLGIIWNIFLLIIIIPIMLHLWDFVFEY